MKNIILSTLVIVFVLFSCKQKEEETTIDQTHPMHNGNGMMENDSTEMHGHSNMKENHEVMYHCSMHPEVSGMENGKCPKCGMELTESTIEKMEENN